MTLKEAGKHAQEGRGDDEVKKSLCDATAREIQGFIHEYARLESNSHLFNLAKVALDIRLAEDAARQADKLLSETDKLIVQTEKLVKFTKGLYCLTIVLVVLGLFQIIQFLLN